MTADLHRWKLRDGARPLHAASCPCWRGELQPTSFTALREPRASLWDYLSSPLRSRGRGLTW